MVTGSLNSPSISMDLSELASAARFQVGDPVHCYGNVYRVTARYYRKSERVIVYDLIEVVFPGNSPRIKLRMREHLISAPSLSTLGLAPDPTDDRVQRARGRGRGR